MHRCVWRVGNCGECGCVCKELALQRGRDGTTTVLCDARPPKLRTRKTQNRPRYIKHVLGRIYVFFTVFAYWVRGGGGGGLCPQGLLHNLLMHFSACTAQKSKFPQLTFLML